MRSQIIMLILGVLGALGGGWLVGVWCFGLVLIALSGGLIGWALFRDDGAEPEWQPQVYGIPSDGMAPDVRKFMDRVRGAA